MESLRENKPLLYSLMVSGGAIVALSSGLIPELQEQFQLVELEPEVWLFDSKISLYWFLNSLDINSNTQRRCIYIFKVTPKEVSVLCHFQGVSHQDGWIDRKVIQLVIWSKIVR